MLSHFARVKELVEIMREAVPERVPPKPPVPHREDKIYRGRRLLWISDSTNYVVRIPSANLQFSESHRWVPARVASFLEYFRLRGKFVTVPAARVWKISEQDVSDTQRLFQADALHQERGMIWPWSPTDIGSYAAQVIVGNHRALAAICAKEPEILVYANESSRKNVDADDWAAPAR